MLTLKTVKEALRSEYVWDERFYGMLSIRGRVVAVCDICVHLTVGPCKMGVAVVATAACIAKSIACIIISPVANRVLYCVARCLSPERVSNLNKVFDVKTNKAAIKTACIHIVVKPLLHLAIRVGMVVINVIGLGFPDIARAGRIIFVDTHKLSDAAAKRKAGSPETREGIERESSQESLLSLLINSEKRFFPET